MRVNAKLGCPAADGADTGQSVFQHGWMFMALGIEPIGHNKARYALSGEESAYPFPSWSAKCPYPPPEKITRPMPFDCFFGRKHSMTGCGSVRDPSSLPINVFILINNQPQNNHGQTQDRTDGNDCSAGAGIGIRADNKLAE